jgi:hypothetical protein
MSGTDRKVLILIFFLILHGGGWSPNWVHSARRPFIGLLNLANGLWWPFLGGKVARA